jgi:hypothetical protein
MARRGGGKAVSVIKHIVGFDVDDHRIRGLMRFIEMTSRELLKEDIKQVRGPLI